MKILITGASGLVGTHLIPTLFAKGHEVFKLVRRAPQNANEVQWNPPENISDSELAKLENFDAVIHLAGDNVADGKWTDEKKRRIKESRTLGTRVLVDALKKLKSPPKDFISASAIGFYGDRGEEILDENSPQGKGFFPEICSEWEAEIQKAAEFARVVMLRIGVVLTSEGGALGKMLAPFKLGAGGVIGSGKQYMSWVAIDDLIKIFHFALENKNLTGAVNAVAPNPVNNAEFTKTLAGYLNRPTLFPIPAFAIKIMFGEMGETLLLQGARVIPEKLLENNFKFDYEKLEDALKASIK